MVTSSAVEAVGEVQANPFWSQRAQEELRLRAARPSTLDDTPASASNASTELRQFEEIPPLPAGEPQSFAPQGMTESTTSPEPNPGLRPGERQVLTEMKNWISTLIGQNRDLCGQNADLQQRLERLEEERSNSQAWRSAPSGGGAEASETLDQGWRASTWGSSAMGMFVPPENSETQGQALQSLRPSEDQGVMDSVKFQLGYEKGISSGQRGSRAEPERQPERDLMQSPPSVQVSHKVCGVTSFHPQVGDEWGRHSYGVLIGAFETTWSSEDLETASCPDSGWNRRPIRALARGWCNLLTARITSSMGRASRCNSSND